MTDLGRIFGPSSAEAPICFQTIPGLPKDCILILPANIAECLRLSLTGPTWAIRQAAQIETLRLLRAANPKTMGIITNIGRPQEPQP